MNMFTDRALLMEGLIAISSSKGQASKEHQDSNLKESSETLSNFM